MINPDRLMALRLPRTPHGYVERDVMLYALSIGIGADPLDRDQLRFVYEKNLRVVPMFAATFSYVGSWTAHPDAGLDQTHLLHGEYGIRFHRALPARATVVPQWRVVDIVDKGAEKGALVFTETVVTDEKTGEKLVTIVDSLIARKDGGFGGSARSTLPPITHPVPDRAPDHVCDMKSLPQFALLFRLNGDYTPLHSDPDHAALAGFSRPISHGLGTFGIAGHAILKTLCGYDDSRLCAMSCRFAAPAYPGDTLRTEMWQEGDSVSFRTLALERNVVVLSNGRAEIGPE